ncbi:MAG: winged helix-turn-helix domain-containing protein [Thermoplasmata archaeon]|nr:winged helix-turn-helix domain-containing protein [Thermoplasmata archaeon]
MDKPDLYVVARFLEALWIKGGGEMRRQELQMAVRVNYNLFVKYLGFLKNRGLVNETEDGIVKITAKGADAYSTLVRFVKEVVNGELF